MNKEAFSFPKKEVPNKETFEEQYSRIEKYAVAGGIAEVVDITPEKLENRVPVLLAPAWGCTIPVYKPTMKEIAGKGRRVISLNHPRNWGNLAEAAPAGALEKYSDQKEELRKALNILGTLEQKKDIGKVDVIAHSEAAINVLIAAALNPKKFRNIVLFAPAGLIGKDSLTRLLQGFAGQNKRAESLKGKPDAENWPEIPVTETEKEISSAAIKEVLAYFAKNPIRSLNEVMDVSRSEIITLIKYLHEKGIGIIVASGVDDPVFPMEKIQENLKANDISEIIDGFLSLRGGHGEMGNHPELFIPAILSLLDSLEKKKRAEKKTAR